MEIRENDLGIRYKVDTREKDDWWEGNNQDTVRGLKVERLR